MHQSMATVFAPGTRQQRWITVTLFSFVSFLHINTYTRTLTSSSMSTSLHHPPAWPPWGPEPSAALPPASGTPPHQTSITLSPFSNLVSKRILLNWYIQFNHCPSGHTKPDFIPCKFCLVNFIDLLTHCTFLTLPCKVTLSVFKGVCK